VVTGTLLLRIRLHGCRSLKEKRRPRQMLRDRIRSRFKVAVSEVADQDTLNLLSLGIATVGPDPGPVQQVLQDVATMVSESGVGELIEDSIELHRR
jgi:uncharacterized protein